jgi:glycosyltransferase involved in cell wall biosynthesis
MSVDYSIVVPAYNEKGWLPKTIPAIQDAMAGQTLSGELIVCDNNSSDGTGDLARTLGAQVVFEPVNQISRARNSGARHAQGRYLVFVDADTFIPDELLREALDRLESGQYCGGGALVTFDTEMTWTFRLGSNAWNWLSKTMKLAAGCFVFCRRDDFISLGGFSEEVYASEEIWLSRQLRRLGKSRGQDFDIIEQPPAHSSGRKLEWYSTGRQAMLLVMLTLFPFAVRFKSLCGFWYRRPEQ